MSSQQIPCAVYTRKSSEEGLEQSFNSLEAQREACIAYISSQKHEGWVAVKERYDDGGFSGGTMERPALRQLLDDISAGKVQTVVVYKVDRPTRSLADFAKIIEVLIRRIVVLDFVPVLVSGGTACRAWPAAVPHITVTSMRRIVTRYFISPPNSTIFQVTS
jgi:hypothetical protein